MKTYQSSFYVGACEVNMTISAENENKAFQLATLMCIESNGNVKTVKIN